MAKLFRFYSNINVVESISDGIMNILGLQKATKGEMVEILIKIYLFNKFKYK